MKKTIRLFIVTITLAFVLIWGAAASEISGVGIFPPDHVWNTPADTLPVDTHSASYVTRIGAASPLHPDFGSGLYNGAPMGIPFNIVDNSVTKTAVTFEYDDESDPGPYPIPANPLIEGGSTGEGDRHMLIIQRDEKVLYELYAVEKQTDGSWHAGSGAVFNLEGYQLRPAGWTSADAAGLAILPGLVRYDEVANGEITHAIRFTAPRTLKAYVWPGRHYASSITDPSYPPMGQRFRLKTSFDTSGYPYQARVVLNALKKYGMILSDNGGAWFITGSPDDRWDNDALHTLAQVKGSDFEAVDSTSLMIDQDSGQVGTIVNVVALPGSTAPPTDPDLDGLYEDLNGNGEAGFSDVVQFFKNIDWIADNEPVSAFDFNQNGAIGFQDIVMLFREL